MAVTKVVAAGKIGKDSNLVTFNKGTHTYDSPTTGDGKTTKTKKK